MTWHRAFPALLLGLTAVLPAAVEDPAKPNILVIVTDDQGWGDLGIHGNPDLKTPNLDSLACDGVAFDRFYVSPVCSPTRAEFLTGRHHWRTGVQGTSRGGERMDLDEETIAEVLGRSGYATGMFGKWHNGMQYPYHPLGRGFDEFYGFCSGHWGDYFNPWLEHNGEPVKGKGYTTDDFTDRAAEFMTRCHGEGKPFFVWLAYNTPHSPMQVPDRWWREFKDREIVPAGGGRKRRDADHTRAALAMCGNIDWNVGRLLATIDDLGIRGRTLVLFFSDNGPNGPRWNGGMKGIKGSLDEGGIRSPLLARWPGTIPPGGAVGGVCAAIDLLPTIAGLAGVPLESPKPLDGISLAAAMKDPSAALPDRRIISHWNGRISIRDRRFRLDPEGRLFDMVGDPGQTRDVAAMHPETARELRAAAADWRKKVAAELQADDRPFPIAHPDVAWTHLPARDALSHGGIRRSSIHPNCSYFLDWKSPQDRITWDVEVGAAGDYEVELWYACPEKDLGSTLELSLGSSRLRGRVEVAHDPPARGGENDRAVRTESLVKDFRPMKLGVIWLEQGRGELTLRAPEIPGGQAMEFRQLTLRRVGASGTRDH